MGILALNDSLKVLGKKKEADFSQGIKESSESKVGQPWQGKHGQTDGATSCAQCK